VTRQDILEKQVKSSYLGIGSNLGDKLSNINKAKNLLNNYSITIEDISSYYETYSWPNKKFPKFLNIIIKIRTELSLIELFKIIKKIEKKMGRKKALRNYPRICDIDIIDFKGLCLESQINSHRIITPHPRMDKRNFVILPLYEVNKTWIHPKTKANISSIINQFKKVDFSDIRIVSF
tara:strand:+ start:375 stop:908 length:534 start_codon:yes stop_codon:yes gene_type:complete